MKTYMLGDVECAAVHVGPGERSTRNALEALNDELFGGKEKPHICSPCPLYATCSIRGGVCPSNQACRLPEHLRREYVAVPLPLYHILKMRLPPGTIEETP